MCHPLGLRFPFLGLQDLRRGVLRRLVKVPHRHLVHHHQKMQWRYHLLHHWFLRDQADGVRLLSRGTALCHPLERAPTLLELKWHVQCWMRCIKVQNQGVHLRRHLFLKNVCRHHDQKAIRVNFSHLKAKEKAIPRWMALRLLLGGKSVR